MMTTRSLAVQDVWSILDIIYGELGDLPDHQLPDELHGNETATLECGQIVLREASIWKAIPDQIAPSKEEAIRLERILGPLAWREIWILSRGISRESLHRILRQSLEECGY